VTYIHTYIHTYQVIACEFRRQTRNEGLAEAEGDAAPQTAAESPAALDAGSCSESARPEGPGSALVLNTNLL
jgi:hypothetical protein